MMSVSIEQALVALRFPPDSVPSSAEVMESFSRLSRRYPPASFPERFQELLQARDVLLDPSKEFRELMLSRDIDVSWIRRLNGNDESNHESSKGIITEPRELFLTLLRESIKIPLDEDHQMIEQEIMEMFMDIPRHKIDQLFAELDSYDEENIF